MYQDLEDFKKLAKERLSLDVYSFITGGSADEYTKKANQSAYRRYALLPKVLTGVEKADLKLALFGQSLELPILPAPMSMQRLCHTNAELETLAGINQAGSLMVVGAYSTTALSKIKQESMLRPWYQLYFLKDRGLMQAMIELAESLEYSALMITVDMPFYPLRDRELKTPLKARIQIPDFANYNPGAYDKNSTQLLSTLLDPSIDWSDLEWLRTQTKLPIIVKGILRVEDAQQAVKCGSNGLVVSNHGGRQLDTAPASVEMLARIVDTVGSSFPVLVDGGIRRGTDVLKALALGARAVLVGRPVAWGLAGNGHTGVYTVLKQLGEELRQAMLLCGCKDLQAISQDLLIKQNTY